MPKELGVAGMVHLHFSINEAREKQSPADQAAVGDSMISSLPVT